MVLQTAPEVGELDGGDRPGDAAVLFGVQPLLARIEQHAVAVDVALVVIDLFGCPRLSKVMRVGPDVLVALPCFCELCRQCTPCQ